MPVILPTPAELAAMPWHARNTAERRALDTLRELLNPTGQSDIRTTPARPVTEFGEYVRAQARALQAVTPPDPDAAAHRHALIEQP